MSFYRKKYLYSVYIYMYIYNRSVSIIEYKMEQTYIHMYMCMRLKTIMKPCLYIYILMCIFSCSICLFENLADGKFQNLGNWIFFFRHSYAFILLCSCNDK